MSWKEITPEQQARSLIKLAITINPEMPEWLKGMMERWLKENPEPETAKEAAERFVSELIKNCG